VRSDTFNEALQNPESVRSRRRCQFDHFVAQLTRLGFIEPWNFAPSTANVRSVKTFEAVNHGGETHTFTEVAEFGGGFIQFSTTSPTFLMWPQNAVPDALEADDFVAPGGTYRETVDHAGHLKFQCCIHPWMRLERRAGDGSPSVANVLQSIALSRVCSCSRPRGCGSGRDDDL